MLFKKYCISWCLINEVECWSLEFCNKTAVEFSNARVYSFFIWSLTVLATLRSQMHVYVASNDHEMCWYFIRYLHLLTNRAVGSW